MLVIRFQRVGRRNDPAFRIVVTEKRSKPKSGELEILGSFYPKTKETRLRRERILHWLSQGAQASPRTHNLFVSEGVIQGKKIDVSKRPAHPASPPDGQAGKPAAPAAAATPEAPAVAAPATEAKPAAS